MTNTDLDSVLTLAHALGDAIRVKDWTLARHLWDQLTALYPPLLESHRHLAAILRDEEAMVEMAGRQSTCIH